MNTGKFTINYLKPFWGQVVLYILLSILSVMFMLCTILSVNDFVKLLFPLDSKASVAGGNASALNQASGYIYDWLISMGKSKALLYFSLILFTLYSLKNIFGYLSSRVMVALRAKVVRNIRNDLYDKVLRLSLSFYGKSRKGDLVSRFSNDLIEYDEAVLRSYHQAVLALITVIFYIAALLYINPILTAFVLLFLPLGAFLISRISRKLRRKSLHMQQKNSLLLFLAEETISGLRIIKAYTSIQFFNSRFQRHNKSYTRLRNAIYRRVDLASPVSDFLGNFMVIIVLLFGSHLVLAENSTFTPSIFVVYIILFATIINPIKDISTSFYNLRKGKGIINRITEIFSEKEQIQDKEGSIQIHSFNSNIEFKDVSFSYEKGDIVLSKINLIIPKGQSIALVGPSGAGKSTLVDLIARFYDCSSGEVLIDGKNVKDLSLKSIRNLISFVTQDTILFNDTILNNIALGIPEATEEEIVQAAKVANAHEFISKMKQGYHTQIGDRGGKLSGGQRQRISIARAVLKNAPILILDEATSALDTESERLVQNSLYEIMKNRTSIVIAHRLSTIQNADQIIVMDKGEIVQKGSHAELIRKEGVYQKLRNMQTFE